MTTETVRHKYFHGTKADADLLLAMAEMAETDPMGCVPPVKDIAKRLNRSRSGLYPLLGRLRDRGYIERVTDPLQYALTLDGWNWVAHMRRQQ